MFTPGRNRSYGNRSPASCAVSMFGVGVVLLMGGIVLMVITRNTKSEERPMASMYAGSSKEHTTNEDSDVKQDRYEKPDISGILKTAAPICLGLGATIVAIFLVICTVVACIKGMKSLPPNHQLPPSKDRALRPSTPEEPDERHASYVVNPISQASSPCNASATMSYPSHTYTGNCSVPEPQEPMLDRPPSYNDISTELRFGGSSGSPREMLVPVKSN